MSIHEEREEGEGEEGEEGEERRGREEGEHQQRRCLGLRKEKYGQKG